MAFKGSGVRISLPPPSNTGVFANSGCPFSLSRLNLIPFLIPFCFWFRLSDPCLLDFVLQKSHLEFKIAEGGDECWGGIGDVDACIAEFAAHGIRAS